MFPLLIMTLFPVATDPRDLTRVGQSSAAMSEVPPRIFVLAVGIADFQNLAKEEDLSFTEADTTFFLDALKQGARGAIAESDVHLLLGEAASLYGVREGLQETLGAAGPNDVVILYFSTHGEVEGNAGYLLTYDTSPENIPFSSLGVEELLLSINSSEARHVLLFTDACYSSSVGAVGARGGTPAFARIQESMESTKRSFFNFASSLYFEQSLESVEYCGGHGAFTCALVGTLNGGGDLDGDGAITLSELGLVVPQLVYSWTKGAQQPEPKGTYDGGLVLSVPAQAGEEPDLWRSGRGYSFSILPAPIPPRGVPTTGPTIGVGRILMGTTELTQGVWDLYHGDKPGPPELSSLPKTGVSWCDTLRFANRMSVIDRDLGLAVEPVYTVPTGCERGEPVIWHTERIGYRLPTEAEWNYAAKAGSKGRSFVGDQEKALLRAGYFGENSRGILQPVGGLLVNPWGLFDVHGNALEWVWDDLLPESADPALHHNHLLKGGCAYDSADRGWLEVQEHAQAWAQSRYYGFRLALSQVPQ